VSQQLHVTVDLDLCVSAGQCALAAPEVFDQDLDDGHSIVLVDPVPAEHAEEVRLASFRCPAQAIHVFESAA